MYSSLSLRDKQQTFQTLEIVMNNILLFSIIAIVYVNESATYVHISILQLTI